MTDLVSITDQKAVTNSLIVAGAFEKQHRNVLRAINRLECSDEFRRLNFESSSYLNAQNKPQPMYHITRDGFTFLAMGFSGKKAAEFKEQFIAAFNQMEQALIEDQGELRRVDVNHKRGITNPHGLDVQYRLDLTKIVMQPSRESLEILQRLTGIDMSGIVAGKVRTQFSEVPRWIEEECVEDIDATISAREAYQAFRTWWFVTFDEDPPSQKRFGDAMTQVGFKKDRGGPGGSIRYRGLELRPPG